MPKKPKVKTVKVVDYLEAVDYLVKKHKLSEDQLTGHARQLWLFLIDSEIMPGKDTYSNINFADVLHDMRLNGEDAERPMAALLLIKIIKAYGDKDLLWRFSW